MAFILTESVEIDAPLSTVWQVIVDLPRYAEWNPFVVAAESTLEVGASISMWVRIFPYVAQPQKETILEHIPSERLCYGVTSAPINTIRSLRCHEVSSLSPARTRYTSRFELTGWLAPLVERLLGGRLRAGFAANTASLKRHAECLGGPKKGPTERSTTAHA